jgi:hypothetical protein
MLGQPDKHRVKASTAPRNSRVPGSPEWCYQTLNLLQDSYRDIALDSRRFDECLAELRQHRAWEKVPIGKPYGTEDRMFAAELGKRADEIEAQLRATKQAALAAQNRVADQEDRENQRPPHIHINRDVYTNETDINVRPSGTSSEYAIRKLRKDRPDIHERVLSGELTPHGGMVEAGFRKKSPSQKLPAFERIRRLIERCADDLTEAERRQLRELL